MIDRCRIGGKAAYLGEGARHKVAGLLAYQDVRQDRVTQVAPRLDPKSSACI